MNVEASMRGEFASTHSVDMIARLPIGRRRFRLRIYALLVVLDVACITGSFVAASLIRFGTPFAISAINILAVLIPLYLGFALNRGLYGSDFFNDWRQNTQHALAGVVLASLAVLFVGFYLRASAEMSRAVFTVGFVLSFIALLAVRWVLLRYSNWLAPGDAITKIVICDGAPAPYDAGAIVIDAATLGLRPDAADPTARDRLGRIVHHADRVVIACADERREAWASVLKGCGVQGEIVMHELADLGTLGATTFAGLPTLLVSGGPLSLRDRLVKRAVDLLFALTALAFLAPLMIITAIGLKLDTRGPLFFVQPRLGRGNRLFPMYKFRSMRSDMCDPHGNRSTQRGDPRVTRVGRLIRATSIDELPQLLNVLRGEMSIVGPRPHALGSLAGDKLFWEVDHRYWNRHVAKPGITGLAQVRGFRGATHLQSDLVNRLQADLEYMNGWTIWRDVKILAATLKVVLHRNAY